jgi:hypothetical protein
MAEPPDPVSRAAGWALIVLGGGWALFCGGCTVYIVASAGLGAAPVALIFGAVGVLIGVLILRSGRAVTGKGRNNRDG